MNLKNFIFTFDAYKWDHESLYPDGFENSYAHMICRSLEYHKTIIPFGDQYLLKQWVSKPITQEMLDEAKETAIDCFGNSNCINHKSWQRIIDEFDGKLPIIIKSVPEGLPIPTKNVLTTVEATVDGFGWLASGIETLWQHKWYTTQTATRSYEIVKGIKGFMEETSDNVWFAQYMLCDFGQRSVTCMEQAGIGGMSVLLNTYSSDTMMAVPYSVNFYNADRGNLLKSVRATEHAVSSPYGDGEGELTYVRSNLDKSEGGIRSFVADTQGIVQFVEKKLPILKDDIVDYYENGCGDINKVVIRPDSPRFEGDTPEDQVLWMVESIAETFGYTTNNKGYKVLHPCISTLYGDGISETDITNIYQKLKDYGWSAENTLVGMGGGLLQKDMYRDALATAFKASSQKFDGEWRGVFKNTSDKTKVSKAGKMKLVYATNEEGQMEYQTWTEDHPLYNDVEDVLQVIFKNGEIVKHTTFDEVKANIGLWQV